MAEKDSNDPVMGMAKVLLVLTIAGVGIFGLVVVIADAVNYAPQYVFFD